MPDIVDPATRSRMMSGIRSANTKPEIVIRRGLHGRGFRYRLHPKEVIGRPDILLPRYDAAILVHGCFWHGHDCSLFRLPGTRQEFWKEKISRNQVRDATVLEGLDEQGWRAMTVWECAIRGPGRIGEETAIDRVAAWLVSDTGRAEIRGTM